MTTNDPEKRGNGTSACFPVSREAASAVFRYLATPEDHLEAHRAIMLDMIERNHHAFDMLVNIARGWELTGEGEIGFTGGMALGYRALQEQALLNGATVPVVSPDVAATYATDLNQDGHRTAGPYLLRRSDELEFEDPYYFETLRLPMQGQAEAGHAVQGHMTVMAGVMLYDMVKKQAYVEEMYQHFED